MTLRILAPAARLAGAALAAVIAGCSAAPSGPPEGAGALSSPSFTQEEISRAEEGTYESYGHLDPLGRCASAQACLGPETMPEEGAERGDISSVRPSGWVQAEYGWIDGGVLYNRCHPIAWALSAEDANERNLVTGTRQMNLDMLEVEEAVARFIDETGRRVLYRSTPVFEGSELVCRGVLLEAVSIGDGGGGLSVVKWCANEQDGVEIDYATGESRPESDCPEDEGEPSGGAYALNTSSMKIHSPERPAVDDISPANREPFDGTAEEAEVMGCAPCGICGAD